MARFFVLILLSAMAHISEEYFGGWVLWANQWVHGVTSTQFWFVNACFIWLIIVAMLVRSSVLKASIFVLLLTNATMHIGATILFRQYSPGVITSVLLYLPLSALGLLHIYKESPSRRMLALKSVSLGFLWMLCPVMFQVLRTMNHRPIHCLP